MKSYRNVFKSFAGLALGSALFCYALHGQPGPGGMGSNMMGGGHEQMMAEHQKMMQEMQNMDAELDRKVAVMNKAQGNAKVEAMAAVINELVKERQMMRQRMTTMQEHMGSHMPGMMHHGSTNMPGMGGTPPQ